MLPGLEPAELPADAVEVGRILDAWGIMGWFKVQQYSVRSDALLSSKRWFLLPAEKGAQTFDCVVRIKIKETQTHSGNLVACALGVDDRDGAEALRGGRIFIARSCFPTLDDDEYYWVDLIGLPVFNRQGEALGNVRDLLSTGPQTVLVIEYLLDGKLLERMIPFVAAYVDDVDLVARRVVVDWQVDY